MDRLSQLEEQIQRISREVKEVRLRIGHLEAGHEYSPQAPSGAGPEHSLLTSEESESPAVTALPFSTGTISLVGRTLMVLGGAFLLRTMTDSGGLPSSLGALVGLAYGVWWLGLAYRAARASARMSAAFHGAAALLIAYPLIWETTTRLEVFRPETGAVLLVGFYITGYAVTWRCNLAEVAWMNSLFAVAAALALLVATHALMPFTVVLLLFASATEWRAYRRRWPGLRWPVALGLDAAVSVMVSIVSRPDGLPEGYAPVSLSLAFLIVVMLPLLYLSSIAVRTLLRGRRVSVFEISQASLALAIGVGGAMTLSESVGLNASFVGAILVLIGAAGYGTAFAFIDRQVGRGWNFYFYTTLAGVLTLYGTSIVLAGAALTITWSALALTALGIGGFYDRITLRFHGAVYLAAAASLSGLWPSVRDSLIAHPAGDWSPTTPLSLLVAFTVALGYGLLVVYQRKGSSWSALLPQAITAGLLAWVSAGLGALWLAGMFTSVPGPDTDMAFLATSRTAVLCILSVVMAWAAGKYSLRELGWLVYPLLLGVGLRLPFEDLPYGRPATLFITLALYGGALVATSSLMKKNPTG